MVQSTIRHSGIQKRTATYMTDALFLLCIKKGMGSCLNTIITLQHLSGTCFLQFKTFKVRPKLTNQFSIYKLYCHIIY
ncbi:hypothetical protein EB796_023712 [Bugula neritina]|uniref:Uncharacterized protein n=1 Tax=Bugula neritina TaxID=10212 RepID=A0A7J7IVL4_BUGNE|nr:hypothetical protein EB796_023712 [Bugula neritina]